MPISEEGLCKLKQLYVIFGVVKGEATMVDLLSLGRLWVRFQSLTVAFMQELAIIICMVSVLLLNTPELRN